MSFRRLFTAGLIAGMLGMVGFVAEAQAQLSAAGVNVDSQGVLKRSSVSDPRLTRQRMAAARCCSEGSRKKNALPPSLLGR